MCIFDAGVFIVVASFPINLVNQFLYLSMTLLSVSFIYAVTAHLYYGFSVISPYNDFCIPLLFACCIPDILILYIFDKPLCE